MHTLQLLLLTASIVCSVVTTLATAQCGVERWPIKVATDTAANKISAQHTPATVNQLSLIQAPINPAIKTKTRYTPTELTVYEVTAKITLVKQEADSDYHIVLADDNGNTMIVESPAPNCATGSHFYKQIVAVRRAIDAKLGGAGALPQNNLNLMVTVTGVGFFDRIHGQTGVASNGIELHPLIDIVFHNAKSMGELRDEISQAGYSEKD